MHGHDALLLNTPAPADLVLLHGEAFAHEDDEAHTAYLEIARSHDIIPAGWLLCFSSGDLVSIPVEGDTTDTAGHPARHSSGRRRDDRSHRHHSDAALERPAGTRSAGGIDTIDTIDTTDAMLDTEPDADSDGQGDGDGDHAAALARRSLHQVLQRVAPATSSQYLAPMHTFPVLCTTVVEARRKLEAALPVFEALAGSTSVGRAYWRDMLNLIERMQMPYLCLDLREFARFHAMARLHALADALDATHEGSDTHLSALRRLCGAHFATQALPPAVFTSSLLADTHTPAYRAARALYAGDVMPYRCTSYTRLTSPFALGLPAADLLKDTLRAAERVLTASGHDASVAWMLRRHENELPHLQAVVTAPTGDHIGALLANHQAMRALFGRMQGDLRYAAEHAQLVWAGFVFMGVDELPGLSLQALLKADSSLTLKGHFAPPRPMSDRRPPFSLYRYVNSLKFGFHAGMWSAGVLMARAIEFHVLHRIPWQVSLPYFIGAALPLLALCAGRLVKAPFEDLSATRSRDLLLWQIITWLATGWLAGGTLAMLVAWLMRLH